MIYCAKANGEKEPWRKALKLLLTLESFLQASPVSYGSAVGCAPWHVALDLLQRCHLRGMVPSTVVLNNALGAVKGGAPCDQWMRVLQLLTWQPSATPDVISYSSAIASCESWVQALSILQMMEADQVQPNLITCNGIMDICHKTGEWQVALGLLSLMSSSEVEADSISYNSAIGACQASGEVRIALSLLAQMRSQRIQAVTVTYNISMAVCERRGHWRQALWLLAAMEVEEVVPDVISCSSNVSACGFVAAWSTALALTLGGVEDVFSFNAAISACDKGGQFTSALRLLDLMSEAVVVPDVITFNGIISASGKDRHWRHACGLLSQILARNISPNIISYNSAINACARRWSQAVALLSAAVDRGLRCDSVGRSSFLGAAPPWRVALGTMDGMNEMAGCEMLVNACDASGIAFLQILRLLLTLSSRRAPSTSSKDGHGHQFDFAYRIRFQIINTRSAAVRPSRIDPDIMLARPLESLLAGNSSVSLGPDGTPTASMNHPSGAACQVSLPGSRVTSWKHSDRGEILVEGAAGGLLPCGLEGIIAPTDWTIQSLVGLEDEVLMFSTFAEVKTAEGVPVRARTEVQLGPNRISMILEVSHCGADEMEWEEEQEEAPADARERSAKRSRILPLHLPHAGLQGSLRCHQGTKVPAEPVDASKGIVLESGTKLETFGFSQVKLALAGDVLQFKALAPCEVILQPGETVSGSFDLILC
eukprot:s141_g7.t1